MTSIRITLGACALMLALVGCGDDDGRGDGGGGGGDGSTDMDGGGCVPTIEICGDRMDQDCNGRDTSCGDSDVDGVEACRAGDDLTRCDCDDSRMDVRPPVGSLAGAPEMCDMRDNDCNGRVDEASACCAGCESLGADRDRADICNEAGTCVCSTEGDGSAPCPEGQTCCGGGCTDTNTDIMNCGFCNSACTNQADNCSAGECRCGSGPPCDLDTMCTGACG